MASISASEARESVDVKDDASTLTFSNYSELWAYRDYEESSSRHSSTSAQFSQGPDSLRSASGLTISGIRWC